MNYLETVATLREFDLITDEQVAWAQAVYAKEEAEWNWWFALSDIAWQNLPWYKRFFRGKLGWQFDWMHEARW